MKVPLLDLKPQYLSLKKEIDGLSNVLRKQITLSRQHFLKLNMPQTYRNLLSLDITDDYYSNLEESTREIIFERK